MGELHRWAEGVCLVLEGNPSQGMRMLERCRERAAQAGLRWGVLVTDLYIATTYARIATGEANASALVAVRNPGFVMRHALPARRKARRALDAFERDHLRGEQLEGPRFAFEYERAKFLAHERDIEGARQAANRARAVTEAYGDSEGREAVKALLERLERAQAS